MKWNEVHLFSFLFSFFCLFVLFFIALEEKKNVFFFFFTFIFLKYARM